MISSVCIVFSVEVLVRYRFRTQPIQCLFCSNLSKTNDTKYRAKQLINNGLFKLDEFHIIITDKSFNNSTQGFNTAHKRNFPNHRHKSGINSTNSISTTTFASSTNTSTINYLLPFLLPLYFASSITLTKKKKKERKKD